MLRALKRAPTAVNEVLPEPETTMREHTCALAALLNDMAIAAATPSAIFLIMGFCLADPLTMAPMEASGRCRKLALR
jgi:hypothetical protein